ncbi:histidine kinase dimerization/phospho-acceptor domain-containing protein [Paenibacillus dendritiformis]|uniref:sensor histidine kinase n=1 Tax=Paenibacillus dendritiformis TaxID=130049 RepID=UPI00248B2987|nr:ATP-binding protein [Paenibacillus dendritiformis]WGU92824.1 histidine kinase dimerization/phospho-acceptor domain-containing protein [Paenibacillus dendritiformis]
MGERSTCSWAAGRKLPLQCGSRAIIILHCIRPCPAPTLRFRRWQDRPHFSGNALGGKVPGGKVQDGKVPGAKIDGKVPHAGEGTVPDMPVQPAKWFGPETLRLKSVLQEKLKDMLRKPLREGIAVELYDRGITGNQNERVWAAMAPMPDDGGKQQYMITVSTLQPVSDASSLLGGFYRYFFLAAIVLLLGFAFLFTRLISHPLVKLNEMAKRLARLDFSARTEMRRQDEIGELAATFDYLANELNGMMGELQAANEQLQRDIEKEKQLELLRKRFVANVSHELKTPVSLIQGYAEALRDNVGQGAKRHKYASVIVNEAERMSRLVKDLLDLSQLESGHFDLWWSNVPLRSTLAYVLQLVEPFATGRALRLDWLPEDEVMVRSDPQRLEQIVTNVLTNAIRHTPEGGRIDIRVQCGAEPGFVRIDVWNEGQPIAEEHLPHVWDAFYRADASSSRQGGGNGIGLSIVKHLLDRHRSRYSIANTDGGVMLTFTLPVAPTS